MSVEDRLRPLELRYRRGERRLELRFADGACFALEAELLRVYSPSAEVQGHGGGELRCLAADKRGVAISAIEPVGNYGVRLVFDDGHDTGIYAFALLRELGERREALWARYRAALGGTDEGRG